MLRVTVDIGTGEDPPLRIRLRPDRGDGRSGIGAVGEVGHHLLLPAGGIILGHPAARLVVAGVADLTVPDQKDAPRHPDGLLHPARREPGHPLIPLAMVVGADVEKVMILAVIPADNLPLAPDHVLRFAAFFRLLRSAPEHGNEPAPRSDGVGLEKLGRRLVAHLRRDDARKVLLHGKFVDGGQLPFPRRQENQVSGEGLLLLPLPVEPDADRHIVQGEGRLPRRGKTDLRRPEDLPAEVVAKDHGAPFRTGGEASRERRPVRPVQPVHPPPDFRIAVADPDGDSRFFHRHSHSGDIAGNVDPLRRKRPERIPGSSGSCALFN